MIKPTTIYFFKRNDGREQSYKTFYSDKNKAHYFIIRDLEKGWFGIYNNNTMKCVKQYSGTKCKKVMMRWVYRYLRKLGVVFEIRIRRPQYD